MAPLCCNIAQQRRAKMVFVHWCLARACLACDATAQPLPADAGLPADNDKTRCEPSGTSCYFLITTASTYAAAQKTCSKLGGGGGFLVAWCGFAIKVHLLCLAR